MLFLHFRRVIVNPDDIEFQETTKERRYEERMEVTWDKGSSGLVFWTDEQYWRETAHDDSGKYHFLTFIYEIFVAFLNFIFAN